MKHRLAGLGRGRLLTVVFLATFLLLGYLLLGPGDGTEDLSGRGLQRSRADSESEDRAVSVPISSEREPVPIPPEFVPEAQLVEKIERHSWILEIAILPDSLASAQLSIDVVPDEPGVAPFGDGWRRKALLASGGIEADITDFFDALGKGPTALEIRVRGPGYVTSIVHVDSTKLDWIVQSVNGTTEHRAVATTRIDAATSVCGSVVNEEGLPVESACLYLSELSAVEKTPSPIDQVETDSDGEFCIQVPMTGEWQLIGLHPVFRPAQMRLSAFGETYRLPEPMVFEYGSSLKVKVDLAGAPAIGMRVSCSTDSRDFFLLEGRYLRWVDGRIERSRLKGHTDGQGEVWFRGLRNQTYSIALGQMGLSPSVGFTFDDQETVRRIAVEGETSMLFSLSASRIDVKLSGPHARGSLVTLRQSGQPRSYGRTLDGTDCSFQVDPGQQYAVRATNGEFSSGELFVTSPQAGSCTTVRLEYGITLLGRLEFEVLSAVPHVNSLHVELSRHDEVLSAPGRYDLVQEASGSFTVRNLESGEYSYKAYANGWLSTALPVLAPLTGELSIVEGSTEKRTLQFFLGGAIRTRALDTEGNGVRATCKVRQLDSAGAQLIHTHLRPVPEDVEFDGTQLTSAKGWTRVFPALQNGRYEVSLSADGFESTTTIVEVEGGEVNSVDVVLKPSDSETNK